MVSPSCPWEHSPKRLVLMSDEVHVWRADLNCGAATVQLLREFLTPEEKDRADRFYFRQDHIHYTVAHAVLRQLLGRYLGILPSEVRLSSAQFGKPELDISLSRQDLRFNMSHAHDHALYGFSLRREVGIDIEFVREDFATLEIAEQFFSTGEVRQLNSLPRQQQARAFFNCWTRKEAYIKALGEGLSHPLDQFTVSLAPGEPARLLSTKSRPQELARWFLVELFPGAGYVAALAVEGGNAPPLRCWQWEHRSSDEQSR